MGQCTLNQVCVSIQTSSNELGIVCLKLDFFEKMKKTPTPALGISQHTLLKRHLLQKLSHSPLKEKSWKLDVRNQGLVVITKKMRSVYDLLIAQEVTSSDSRILEPHLPLQFQTGSLCTKYFPANLYVSLRLSTFFSSFCVLTVLTIQELN